MIALLAPEPVTWLEPLAAVARSAGELRLLAPWAVPLEPPGRLPARLGRAWARRVFAGAEAHPLWLPLEVVASAWAHGQADRLIEARFVRRRLAGAWAARRVDDARAVIAPSLAARSAFAHAKDAGATCVLVEDLPDLRSLNEDLDAAARRHSGERFLRRYRAQARDVAQQEAERALADVLLVRSAYALEARRGAGFAGPIHPLPSSPPTPGGGRVGGAPTGRVLLVGPATARNGVLEALEAVAKTPGHLLVVTLGDGSPNELVGHALVRVASVAEATSFEGIDAVVAPTLVESHREELKQAAARGVPVIATRRAAGFLERFTEVRPGDVAGLAQALAAVPRIAAPVLPADGDAALVELLRTVSRRPLVRRSRRVVSTA